MLFSFCKVMGVHIDKPIHSTAIRKMWVSHLEMSGKTADEKSDMAVLMKHHSRRTAEQWYDLTKKNVQAQKAAMLIQKELAEATATSTSTATPVPSSFSSADQIDKKRDKFFVAAVSNERYIWPLADEKEVREAFKHILQSSKFPAKPTIETFEKNAKMLTIWNYSNTQKCHDRCCEKVQNLYKAGRKKDRHQSHFKMSSNKLQLQLNSTLNSNKRTAKAILISG